ncbi:hypothetical protein J5N97_006856 [Dioscorea zingiberensis]|uniref:RNase H type-1 domain-containing protein n=1 Tax=Dioscorea zingiberensis TaxID=325984 RepID=A0A9D5HT35_9LILI|nr:hypothetical protein J5N97_006856 [Dioscorea zingiberensis]
MASGERRSDRFRDGRAAIEEDEEVADNHCVYRNEVQHSAGERTQVLQDVAADPTLPRTKTISCTRCNHPEVVFFQAAARGEEGEWLDFYRPGNSKYMASIVAAVFWYIWKSRCDKIFKERRPDFSWIAKMAVEHVKDYSAVTADRMGKSFFLINRPAHGYVCIYSAACWDLNNGKGGAGICIVDSNACILLAGCCSMQANSKMDAGAKAVLIAMEWAYRENYNIKRLLVSCTELWKTMNGQDSEIEWRSHPSITNLRQSWLRHEHLTMDFIPWKWNRMAGSLAGHGMNLVSISLFHRGMERPRWLMRKVEAAGFHF